MDYDALERLVKLRDSGALTIAEFEEQKAVLLSPPLDRGHRQSARQFRSAYDVAFWVKTAALIVIVVAAILYFGRGAGELGATSKGDVAAGAFREVQNPSMRCTMAGDAAAAYLSEGNQERYSAWRDIERNACRQSSDLDRAETELQNAFRGADKALGDFYRGR